MMLTQVLSVETVQVSAAFTLQFLVKPLFFSFFLICFTLGFCLVGPGRDSDKQTAGHCYLRERVTLRQREEEAGRAETELEKG